MGDPEDLRIDVGGGLHTAVQLFRPDRAVERPVVAFAFPGGGYSRGYYDIRHEADGYSQAAYHAGRGWIVAACDHLGVGDSDQPDPSWLTIEALAEANHATVMGVLAKLDVEPGAVVGMGQSMGGCLTIVAQARHHTFGAIAILGYSAIHTVLPNPPEADLDLFRWGFHSDDTDPALVDLDFAGGYPARTAPGPPWGSLTIPPCATSMLQPGIIAEQAAAVDVPVFVGCGARDVVPDPRAEPAAYASSDDITVLVVPDMAHMHNFARTREALWHRLHRWGEALRPA